MSLTWEEISTIVQQRRRADEHILQGMRTINAHYYSDVLIPMPDVKNSPDMPALMPQLIHDGIENTALRAAGSRYDIECPSVDPFAQKATERARNRRRVYAGRSFESAMQLMLARAYRQLAGYGTCHFLVTPCYERRGARIEMRDPLTTYPELRDSDDVRHPLNCAYVFGRSVDWLMRSYGHVEGVRELLTDRRGRFNQNTDQLWDVCEWLDYDDIVFGILGPRDNRDTTFGQGLQGMEIARRPNLAECVPIASPRRVTLGRIAGQMDQLVGIVDWMGRLMALEVIAAERGVFPDLVAISEESRQPEMVANRWIDGREGEINLLTNVKDVKVLRQDPGQVSAQVLDRLERAGRHSGGVSAQFSGEMTGSIRSGQTIDSMAGLSIDPRIAELQYVMARTLSTLYHAVGKVEKSYFQNKKLTIFSGWPGDRGQIEYEPSALFDESCYAVVTYPTPGLDVTQQTVAAAQLTGAGLASRRSARRMHPYIDDPEAEGVEVDVERLEDAWLVAVQQQAAAGALPLPDLAEIIDQRQKGMSIVEATMTAQRKAQDRQASNPPPGPAGPPPEQMPGLAQPGMGAEARPPEGVPAVPPPRQALDNFDHLLETLKHG